MYSADGRVSWCCENCLPDYWATKQKQACYFIPAPPAWIELAEQAARALEVPDENIHKEFFGTNTADKPEVELPVQPGSYPSSPKRAYKTERSAGSEYSARYPGGRAGGT